MSESLLITLQSLLDEQWKALEQDDCAKLDALAAQIEHLLPQLGTVRWEDVDASSDDRRRLAELIRSVQEQLTRNRERWLQVLATTRLETQRLQASRRYTAALDPGGSGTGLHFSRSG